MTVQSELRAQLDAEGRLALPSDLLPYFGLEPGVQVRVDRRSSGLHLRQPVTYLGKVYVEPTNACNLECRTCVRNVWDEPSGWMTEATFERIVQGLRDFSTVPTVFFGGFGEPLAHPNMVEMVAQVKALGAQVELITNGTLLTESLSRQLIKAGVDVLWVSLDGATPESYADVRLGAALPEVIDNVVHFRHARPPAHLPRPEIGIAFVAMKRNIADLPAVLRLGGRLGASRFMVSNVLPYTIEMCDEVLYSRSLSDILYLPSPWLPQISLPKIDWDETTREPLYRVMRSNRNVTLAGASLGHANNRCPFIESSVTAIGWDGSLSPCLPLLHSHVSYLNERERFSRRYVVGNVSERRLHELWDEPAYLAFRERVQMFDFAPCTFCGGCNLSEINEEDCFGNTFPTCGGCLWAQGVIQCP
jgi:MoaA/NifB/PqqE/SkfB family radical SAM enzyme